MAQAVVFVDFGHGWKGGEQGYDPGALRNPEPANTEAVMVRHYGAALVQVLHNKKIAVVEVPSLGRYQDRHKWVAKYAQDTPVTRGIYVQCHVNAGGGTYALFEHDAKSLRGSIVASTLAAAMNGMEGITRSITKKLESADRGYTCIAGIYEISGVCGIILEPGFIDAASHNAMFAQPSELARRLGDGLQLALKQ